MFFNQRASLLVGTMLAAGLAAAPTTVDADQINVSATITAACELEGDASLAFGNYNANGDTPGSTTLTVSCTAPSDVGVTLGPGQNPNGALRRMKHGTQATALLGFQLFDGIPWEVPAIPGQRIKRSFSTLGLMGRTSR